MRTPSTSLPVRAGLWAVFAVLAGLMAMHGLGTHGTTPVADTPVADTHASAGTTTHAAVVTAPVAALAAVASPMSMPSHGMGSMAMDCLVVLTLALLLRAALVVRRGRLRTPSLPDPPATGVRRTGRDPDPPDLERLSIRRC